MAVPSLELHCENQTDRSPLLMERPVNQSNPEHIIDFRGVSVASSSGSHFEHPPGSESTRVPNLPSSSTTASLRNSSFRRRGDRYGRRQRSPLNSGLWISIELTVTVSQIIASIIVLALSRDEKPRAPLSAWVVGYAAGCVATLPHLYWRYMHRNIYGPEQDSTHGQLGSAQSNPPLESTSYTSVSVPRILEEEHRSNVAAPNSRLNMLVDQFKMVLDCFFAVWFVVGNVWIFGGHSSSSEAPNLYRLCVVFLTFSCIGYAMPFILCATICCCLPCIISILGFRDDRAQTRGATPESVSALPIYKFKLKGNGDREESEINVESLGGGVIGAGTDKERSISAEDAVCCICLGKYADEEDLRELPCSHFFHVECVDKWLKINALCPLCKHEVGDTQSI